MRGLAFSAGAALALALFQTGQSSFETMVGWLLFVIALGVWRISEDMPRKAPA